MAKLAFIESINGNRLFLTFKLLQIENKTNLAVKKVSSVFTQYVCVVVVFLCVCLCVCLSVAALQKSSFNIGG